MCVVQVPLQPSAARSGRPSQRHQPTCWALTACWVYGCSPRPQQPHEVSIAPQRHVEVAEAVEGVEVGERVVKAATQRTCDYHSTKCEGGKV